MHLDTNLLLTAEKLNLDAGLMRGAKVNGTFAIKRVASQTYLVVDELQARVLDEFTQPRTVPEVLETCIRKRSCPALRDFYDLILKAHCAGVLRSEELGASGPPAAERPPLRWFLPVPPAVALSLAGVAAAALVAVAVMRPLVMPAGALDGMIGWAIAVTALTLGELLAASVLRCAGGEVYPARVRWAAFTPHFAFDLRDIVMVPRMARAGIYAMRIALPALAASVGLWLREAWAAVPLAVLFLQCRPVGQSPGRELLLLLRRLPIIDTERASLFDYQLTFGEQWGAALRAFDARVAAAQFGTTLAWAAAVGIIVDRTLHLELGQALLDTSMWMRSGILIGAALGVVVVGWMANAIQYDIADAIVAAWRRWSVKWHRWLSGQRALADSVDAEMLIRRNPLLRRLAPELQAELAEQARPYTAKAWKKIVGFDQEPAFVALILSGTATVYRRDKSGRKVRFLRVMEGDLFGAHHLVDPEFASLEIRTGTPVHALVFDCAVFKRLVVDPLGAKTVRGYVHNHLFLQRAAPVCADWRPAAVARLAELAITARHAAGGKIISRGQEIGNLYVLYEGGARAVQGRKSLGRIRPGDFFGEISLLQASAATSDVESSEEGRHLTVNRVEFIRFMSRNHHVALQMERLCSKRLGHPVFPLNDQT